MTENHDNSPQWHQFIAPPDDPFCLYPQSGGPSSSLDNEHLSDLLLERSFNNESEQFLSLTPLDDPFCLSPLLDGRPPSFDNEHQSVLASDLSFDYDFETSEIVPSAVRCNAPEQAQSSVVPQSASGDLVNLWDDINLSTRHPCLAPNHRSPSEIPERQQSSAPSNDPFCLYPQLGGPPPDVSFDHGFGTSATVPSAVRCDESERVQSSIVPQSALGDLAKVWDINLSTKHPCLAPNYRPSWLIDSNIMATMIRRASAACNPEHINWKSNPTKECPKCNHIVYINDSNQAWPGLPRGVKFDPSDPEIIEHLLAKNGVDGFPPHPFIDDFIPTIKEADGIYYTHPQKLPGVLPDGTVSHFFIKQPRSPVQELRSVVR